MVQMPPPALLPALPLINPPPQPANPLPANANAASTANSNNTQHPPTLTIIQPAIAPLQATLQQPAAPTTAQQLQTAAMALQQASAPPVTTTSLPLMVSAGLYLGHKMMPLPQKLLSKIIQLEFVEIHDLLPETWLSPMEDTATLHYCSATNAQKEANHKYIHVAPGLCLPSERPLHKIPRHGP